MWAAPCSCRHEMNAISSCRLASASTKKSSWTPGTPNNVDTPPATSWSATPSAPMLLVTADASTASLPTPEARSDTLGHRLRLEETVDPFQTALAADAAVLHAAERQLRCQRERVVDADDAEVEPLGQRPQVAGVGAVEVGGQPVAGGIGLGDHVLLVGVGVHRQHRTEDLLLGQHGRVADVGQHGGAEERAVAQFAVGEPRAPGQHLRAQSDRVGHLLLEFAQGGLVDQRPEVDAVAGARADP